MPFTKPWTLALLAMSCACAVSAQNVPDATLVAGISPISQAAHAWSAKNQILGRSVYNEQGQKIGKVDDVIVAPNNSLSFAIIGTGGFAGLRRHQIALPVGMLLHQRGDFYLSGASKEAVRRWPAFDYARPIPSPPAESQMLVRE